MATLKKGLANIRAAISNKHWIEQLIDDHLDSRQEEVRIGREFHPSAAGKCPRVMQLSMMGIIRDKPEARTKRIFDNGHAMHDRYKRYFERAGKLLEEEAPVIGDLEGIHIRGRADMIVENFAGEKRILELKSINSRKFEELIRTGLYLEDHFVQWNLYSGILGIENGEILYENKDDQRMKIFTISFNQEKFDKTIKLFKFVDYHIEKGILVPKPDICDSRYCLAKDLCKEVGKEEKEIDKGWRLGKGHAKE